MKRYVIERDIPKIGTLERKQLKDAPKKSNDALRELAPDIQWIESFAAADKTFCIYLAKDEAVIYRHAELSGFPASKVTEIRKTFDPQPLLSLRKLRTFCTLGFRITAALLSITLLSIT